MTLAAPESLNNKHDLSAFACGEPGLNTFLTRRALSNQESGASRTFVLAAKNNRVVAYYSLATGSIEARQATGKVRRNMPDPIPVMVLGRLAVSLEYQNRKLGAWLLKDALLRVLGVAEMVGIRAVLLHAMSDRARAFYLKHGFAASPLDPTTLMIPLIDVRRELLRSDGTRS